MGLQYCLLDEEVALDSHKYATAENHINKLYPIVLGRSDDQKAQ